MEETAWVGRSVKMLQDGYGVLGFDPAKWCALEVPPSYRLTATLKLGERTSSGDHVYMHEKLASDGIRDAGGRAWIVDGRALLSYMHKHPDKVYVQNSGICDGIFVTAEWRLCCYGGRRFRLVPCEPRTAQQVKVWRHADGRMYAYPEEPCERLTINRKLEEQSLEIAGTINGASGRRPLVSVSELGGKAYQMTVKSFWEAVRLGWVNGTDIRGTFEIVKFGGFLRIKWSGPPTEESAPCTSPLDC